MPTAKVMRANKPVPTHPLPYWALLLDRLIAPWGTIVVALLVLAWLERHIALLAFTLGYLAVVLVPQIAGTGLTFVTCTIPTAAGLSGSVVKSAAQTASCVSNGVAFDRISDLRNAIRTSSQGPRVAATAYAPEFAKNDPIGPYVRAEAATVAPASAEDRSP